MSLLLLPERLQDLISEFNVEHRQLMRVVMDELNRYWILRIEKDKDCNHCLNDADEQYLTYIFWRKYNFCGEWCRLEFEYDARKSYRYYQKRQTLRR
jgi:hypothetical protein